MKLYNWFHFVICIDIDWNIDFFAFQYLKDQRLPPQTFIPLESVRVKPIMERLRTLRGTAKLIFDVIQYPFFSSGYFEEFGSDRVCKFVI